MASVISFILASYRCPVSLQHTHQARSVPLHSQFVLGKSLLSKFNQGPLSKKHRKYRAQVPVVAAQSNLFKVLQTAWRVGKDGIEMGTNLVPDSVPRPIARVGVAFFSLMVTLFVFNSFLSTAFFVLGMMGLIYFLYIAFNKDEGPRGGGGSGGDSPSTDETLEAAKRIMEKYK